MSKTTKALALIFILLIAGLMIVMCVLDRAHQKKHSLISVELIESKKNFSAYIETENFNDLSLIIYYMHPSALTNSPVSVDGLINIYCENKIVISGEELKRYYEQLLRINDAHLIPILDDAYLNARLCYQFETKKHGKIFEVAFGGSTPKGMCLYVNGIAVEKDAVFIDIVIPFLDEELVEGFKTIKVF